MEPQVELMELTKKAVEENCGIRICLDGTPNDGGVSAEVGAGYIDSQYYTKEAIRVLQVLFLSKGSDQVECLDQLGRICNMFQAMRQYPPAESFTWLDAVTATEPNLVGRQEDGQWIYSAVVNMKIYF